MDDISTKRINSGPKTFLERDELIALLVEFQNSKNSKLIFHLVEYNNVLDNKCNYFYMSYECVIPDTSQIIETQLYIKAKVFRELEDLKVFKFSKTLSDIYDKIDNHVLNNEIDQAKQRFKSLQGINIFYVFDIEKFSELRKKEFFNSWMNLYDDDDEPEICVEEIDLTDNDNEDDIF